MDTTPLVAEVGSGQLTVTVDGLEEPPTNDIDIHIADIRFDSKRGGKDWRAEVESLTGYGNDPVVSVTLQVDFNDNTYTVSTDSNGIARTPWQRKLNSGNYLTDAYDVALEDPEYSWTAFTFDLEDDDDDDGKPDYLLMI